MSSLAICDDSIQGGPNVEATQRKEVRKVSRTGSEVAHFRCDINALWAESAKPNEILAEPRKGLEAGAEDLSDRPRECSVLASRDFLHEPSNSPRIARSSATRRLRARLDPRRHDRLRGRAEFPDHGAAAQHRPARRRSRRAAERDQPQRARR